MGKPVSVFVCGAQKAGTTTLYSYLRLHPEMSASGKELHFFDDETQDWEAPNYEGLEARYSDDDGDCLRFEATPIYAYWPPAMERLRAYNQHAKLILLFRDPFDRAWSQWRMEYGRNAETLPFSEAIRSEADRMQSLAPLDEKRRIYSYIDRGRYTRQMRRVYENFPKHQVLLLRCTELWTEHTAALTRITEFLGIKPFADIAPLHEFKGAVDGLASIRSQDDLDFVADQVGADVAEFSEMTGIDISDWPVIRDRSATVPERECS